MVEHLSPEEVSFFVREGYLVKPAALDPRRIDAARQHWWSHNRVGRLRPDEPATWLGGFRDDELCEDPSNAVSRLSWDCRMVGGDEPLLDLLPRACWGAVTQLLGTDLVIPEGRTKPGSNFAHPGANIAGVGSPGQACRGVYCSMPEPLTPAERAAIPPLPERSSGHCDGWDGTRWRLSLSTTLDDVPPGGGAPVPLAAVTPTPLPAAPPAHRLGSREQGPRFGRRSAAVRQPKRFARRCDRERGRGAGDPGRGVCSRAGQGE